MLFLALETSTRNCSVAIFQGEQILSIKEEHSDQYIHSEKLHLFIEEVLAQAKINASDLEGIAVGSGPGSYTGLRIGVASAKALAYALKIPIISAKGTELMVEQVLAENDLPEESQLLPMIDARRMEVYSACFSIKDRSWTEVKPEIIDENSYQEFEGPLYYFGDGAEKCKPVLVPAKFHYLELPFPSVKGFAKIGLQRFESGNFEDPAYFEPFYLKAFQALKPKRLI